MQDSFLARRGTGKEGGMAKQTGWPRRIVRLAAIGAFAALLAACSSETPEPAPVVQRNVVPGMMPEGAPPARVAQPRARRTIVVRPGQSLSGIAHAYHLPQR